jgi:hypothetical protein
LTTSVPLEAIEARACDCHFCRIHGAKNWSDPRGATTITVADAARLQRYRFALKTADFYICTTCGAYAGAVLTDTDGCWSTVNLRLTALAEVPERPASYGAEQTPDRITRRKRMWTPTTVVGLV